MLIHAYLTDGFFPWAKFFLNSYKYYNGESIPIILSTKGLDKNQIKELESTYKNITIQSSTLNIEQMAAIAGVTIKTLLEYKEQIEKSCINEKSKVWKLMIAADDRVKSLLEVMKQQQSNHKHILHFDIDMYIRNSLNELIQLVKANDVSMRFRLNSKPNRKTLISVMGFKIDKGIKFIERWVKYIDDIEPKNRPIGYGQTSCFFAYRDMKDKFKWGDVPLKFASPHMKESDVIWSANTPKGKTSNLELFGRDFNK